MPYADAARRSISDPGVAVYFTLDGKPLSMERDMYWRVEDNLRSIGLAISAIRAIERHSGSYMMELAFSGFAALPPPPSNDWRSVLGLRQRPSKEDIERAYREKAKRAHPDTGGTTAEMQRLTDARDAGLREV